MTKSIVAMALAVALTPQSPSLRIKPHARAMQPGEVVLLSVTSADPIESLRARAFGHDLMPFQIDARSWQVLVGIDLDVAPGKHPVTLRWTQPGERSTQTASYDLTVLAKSFRTRTLTVDNAFVNPPESTAAQIADDTRALNDAWSTSSPRHWSGAFVAPVPQEANSAFGTRSVFNGQPRSPHSGADFASPAGTPVLAPSAGRVLIARDMYFTGGTVVVDHGLGVISLFAHLSAIDVKENTRVEVGDVLGKVGATGRVTGPHLHWAMRINGARVDPLALLSVLGKPPASKSH